MTNKEIEYNHKKDIKKVIELLSKIGDERTVIVGPEYGDSNGKGKKKLRVYSWGGRVLDLSTTKLAKNDLLKDIGYSNNKYIREDKPIGVGNVSYEDINEYVLRKMIRIAERRANGVSDSDKEYVERSIETLLIKKNRVNSKYKNAVLIDMEFRAAKAWIEELVKYEGKSTTGKPDLIVYDKKGHSFGLIELKYKNQSCNNMIKHIIDFHNIVHSQNSKIKEELCRRIGYLSEYEIIDAISENDLKKAVNNEMWYAFLFVNGNADDSKKIFEDAMKNNDIKDIVDSDNIGFMYVADENEDIDYSKDNFIKQTD